MKARNTLVALLVFGGLFAWVYFYEYRGEEGRRKAEAAEKKVFDFETDKAASLEIEKSGTKVSVRKEDGQWKLTSPIAARADSDEVSGLLSTLSWLEVNQKIEATPADLETYKLKDPPFRLTLTTEGSTAPFVLAVGDKAPIGGVYYARRGDAGDVITVSSSIDRLMEVTADKLRYKKVVGVDSWKVTRFSIARDGSMVAFAKNGEDWRIDSPVSFPADRGKVSNLLYDLTSISADGFEPEGTSAGSVGLAKPEATLQIDVMDGSPVTVEFSAKDSGDPNGLVRARRPDMAEIFKVKPDLLDKLAPRLDDYRDMRVAPVDRWQVSEIDAVSPDGEKKIVKDAESNWRWGDPNGPTLDRKMVEDLLDALDAAKATGVRDGADSRGVGTEPQGVRLSVKAGSAAPVEVRIGAEQDGKVLVGSSASTAIYEVEKSLVDRISDSVRALKAPSPGDTATASGAADAAKPASPEAPSGRKP